MESFGSGAGYLRDQLSVRKELALDMRIVLKDIAKSYGLSIADIKDITERVDSTLASDAEATKRDDLIVELQESLGEYFTEKLGGPTAAGFILHDIFSHVRITH